MLVTCAHRFVKIRASSSRAMLEKGEHVGSATAIRAAAKQLRVLTNVADVALDNMADVNCPTLLVHSA